MMKDGKIGLGRILLRDHSGVPVKCWAYVPLLPRQVFLFHRKSFYIPSSKAACPILVSDKYIPDNIWRHRNCLCKLEKITNVYQEFAAAEAIDDDALFANENDKEGESAFVMYAPPHGLNSIGRNW